MTFTMTLMSSYRNMKNSNKKSDFSKYLDNKMIGNISLRDFLIKISFYLALVIIIPLLFPSGRSFKYTDLRVGSIINKKVIAPFNFPVLKTELELKVDRDKAVSEVPYYFINSDSVFPVQIEKFTRFFDYIGSLPREIKLKTLAESDTSDSLSMNEVVSTLSVDYDATMSVEEISQLLTLLHETNKESLKKSLIAQFNKLY